MGFIDILALTTGHLHIKKLFMNSHQILEFIYLMTNHTLDTFMVSNLCVFFKPTKAPFPLIRLMIYLIRDIRKIHSVFTLSLGPPFTPLTPLLVVSVKVKEILLNLSMKC